ncbi:archaetidylserine decarboxylase [Gallibacterium melopsittaci]|uniref:Phosphatidylserine decarboxylase proenzyme n=1 Tax=Gallibacterium melopsittaci TaxID=516063 RepID=A0ABV6HVG4_9PAST
MNKTITYFDKLKVAFHYVLPQFWVTRAAGWLAEKQWGAVTHAIIRLFIKKYRINMQEALYSDAKDYVSFNQFFIRPLRDGVRPINQDPNALCLPADGRVSQLGMIEEDRLIQAKGHYFSLTDLLAGDTELSTTFKNGQFITTYLSPKDYHRVHMPCAGTLRKMIYVPGELYSVNPFLAEHIPHLFSRNERVICLFETEFGPMVQILVGATITASISTVWAGVINPPRPSEIQNWHYPAKGESGEIQLEKGQEMGAFRLGSTVINIFAENQVEFAAYLHQDTAVRVGELLAHKVQ